VVNSLTSKQKSAIQRARRNPILQRVLFNRAKGLSWFADFKDAGFLNPHDIPAPKAAKEEGYIDIPPWPITEYLVKTSPELSQSENKDYALAFLDFIREATHFAQQNKFGNYRVWWQFAKIVRNLPADILTLKDLTLVHYWLDDLYQRNFVAEVIGDWLVDLLDRNDKHSRDLSLGSLELLYRIQPVEQKDTLSKRKRFTLRFDNWHAARITKNITAKAPQTLGLQSVEVFKTTLEEILKGMANDATFHIWRPAIEDHGQNHAVDGTEDIILEAFRDSLISYFDTPDARKEYIIQLLESTFVTIQRTAIYVIDRQYRHLREFVPRAIISNRFTSPYRHEIWHLLHNHYQEFSPSEKTLTVGAITTLVVTDDEGREVRSATLHRRASWLSSIKEYGQDIGSLYRTYIDELGGEPQYPDFSTYMLPFREVDRETPIPVEELLALPIEQLTTTLADYRDPGKFHEPGLEELVKSFKQVIKARPLQYLNQLNHFLTLDLAFVYEVFEAYLELLNEKVQFPANEFWSNLIRFSDSLVHQDRFWSLENSKRRDLFVANRHWIVSEISRLIQIAVGSDTFPEHLLEQAESILLFILEKQEGEHFLRYNDALSTAINSPRGRCLEAFISLSLRLCSTADKKGLGHKTTWDRLEPIYNSELDRGNKGEFEFATIVARLLPNFLYMSSDWLLSNLKIIFDLNNYKRWLCAMDGYAYVNRVYLEIFDFLKSEGHYLRALDDENLDDKVKDKTIQNIAVGYVSDFESLDDERSLIHQIVIRKKYLELSHLIWFLWTFHKYSDAKISAKILDLWRSILPRVDVSTHEGRHLSAKLCDWIVFIDEVNDRNRDLILHVAPYADEGHQSYDLLRRLAEFSEKQPLEAYAIWLRALERARPDYPPEAIQTIFTNLLKLGLEGNRKAKEIVDRYLETGNERPLQILTSLLKL